jgi:prevent-host-death family protein
MRHSLSVKTVTARTAKTNFEKLIQLAANGEKIQITKNSKTVACLVPPESDDVDWSGTFAKLDEVWGIKPLPGKPGSEILVDGRR